MNKKLIIGGVVAIVIGLLLGQQVSNLGGVSVGSEYQATSTSSTFTEGAKLLQTGSRTVLGSVVITATQNVVMTLIDATSTTDVSSTTIAVIAGNTAAGTYDFNIQMKEGLVVRTPGTWTTGYTITYR